MRIQHNIMAMPAYRNYTNNVSAMKKNLEKLSSGYKINRAGDDAAGLAISEKMRAQITGLETAQKNAKDGISLVQTAEGAMTEVHDMLNRMVELATQSANGTYDNTTDRAQMQKEVDQLRSEINRIADSSNFNGIKLLDGSMEAKMAVSGETDLFKINGSGALTVIADGQLGNKPQAGVFELDLTDFEASAKADGEVKISIFGQDIQLGSSSTKQNAKFSGAEIAKTIVDKWKTDTTGKDYSTNYGVTIEAKQEGSKVIFTMSGAPTKAWDLDSNVTYTNLDNDGKKPQAGNQAQGVQLTTLTKPVDSSAGRRYAQADLDLSMLKIKDGSTLQIGDTTYTFAVGKGSAYKKGENVIDLTDMTEDTVALQDKDTMGEIANRITTAAQNNKNFKVTANTQVGTAANNNKYHQKGHIFLTEREGGVDTNNYKLEGEKNTTTSDDGDWTGFVKFGQVDNENSTKGLTLQIGDTADDFNQLVVSIGDIHTKSLGIGDISIADQDSASKAVDAIKNAINKISDIRGTLGATQNRLDHTINNLSVMTENIQDAESTIRDVDVAEEMMAYTKNNILIQSAQAMLAQANQVPQGVLQLLQ